MNDYEIKLNFDVNKKNLFTNKLTKLIITVYKSFNN